MAEPLTAGRTFGTSAPVLIYAVDTKFSIHVGFDGIRGQSTAVKHETLFHNADVRAAGELEVFEGMIVTVNDHSGSYGTAGDSTPTADSRRRCWRRARMPVPPCTRLSAFAFAARQAADDRDQRAAKLATE